MALNFVQLGNMITMKMPSLFFNLTKTSAYFYFQRNKKIKNSSTDEHHEITKHLLLFGKPKEASIIPLW